MDFLPLLKTQLKSHDMNDLLESWNAQVIYAYDRNNENMPDEFWASIYNEGVCFRFNENQILETIFLYVTKTDGFTPIDLSETDISRFDSIADAMTYAKTIGTQLATGQGELFGQMRSWIRLEYNAYSIHYEFREDVLALVTLTVV